MGGNAEPGRASLTLPVLKLFLRISNACVQRFSGRSADCNESERQQRRVLHQCESKLLDSAAVSGSGTGSDVPAAEDLQQLVSVSR